MSAIIAQLSPKAKQNMTSPQEGPQEAESRCFLAPPLGGVVSRRRTERAFHPTPPRPPPRQKIFPSPFFRQEPAGGPPYNGGRKYESAKETSYGDEIQGREPAADDPPERGAGTSRGQESDGLH